MNIIMSPHLQLEQVYTARNSQVLDTLESKEGGWGDIIQCKLSMPKTTESVQLHNMKIKSFSKNPSYRILECHLL